MPYAPLCADLLAARARLDEVARALESLDVSIRLVAPEPPRDAERLEGEAAVNAAVRLQAKRVWQELGRLRTALVVKADREFGEGERRAIYVEQWEGEARGAGAPYVAPGGAKVPQAA